MKKYIIGCFLIALVALACGQNQPLDTSKLKSFTSKQDVAHIIETLAADSMQGRRTFTEGQKKAAAFIAGQFKEAGLAFIEENDSYYQSFEMVQAKPQKMSIQAGRQSISSGDAIILTSQEQLHWSPDTPLQIQKIQEGDNFFGTFRKYLDPEKSTLVWVDESFSSQFERLKGYLANRSAFADSVSTVFVLTDEVPSTFSIDITNKRMLKKTANIVGVLPGETKPNEYVVFSAHYDHLGKGKPVDGDAIFNGANDNASGTTAVIELAKYFAAQGNNNRTLIFVTFTGEELGGYGSHYFSRQLNPDQVVAMFNIEMIGTTSKWGKNSAYITGFDKSSFGKILQQNLKGSGFAFHPDPYPEKNLFYRSDNATLARLGVPAHTISTSKMDNEPNYHKVSDEVSTLNLANMAQVIHAIAISSQSIVSGEDTPSRVEPKSLR